MQERKRERGKERKRESGKEGKRERETEGKREKETKRERPPSSSYVQSTKTRANPFFKLFKPL